MEPATLKQRRKLSIIQQATLRYDETVFCHWKLTHIHSHAQTSLLSTVLFRTVSCNSAVQPMTTDIPTEI